MDISSDYYLFGSGVVVVGGGFCTPTRLTRILPISHSRFFLPATFFSFAQILFLLQSRRSLCGIEQQCEAYLCCTSKRRLLCSSLLLYVSLTLPVCLSAGKVERFVFSFCWFCKVGLTILNLLFISSNFTFILWSSLTNFVCLKKEEPTLLRKRWVLPLQRRGRYENLLTCACLLILSLVSLPRSSIHINILLLFIIFFSYQILDDQASCAYDSVQERRLVINKHSNITLKWSNFYCSF